MIINVIIMDISFSRNKRIEIFSNGKTRDEWVYFKNDHLSLNNFLFYCLDKYLEKNNIIIPFDIRIEKYV